MFYRRTALALGIALVSFAGVPLAGVSMAAPAAPPPVVVDVFDREVRPILEKQCLGCHGVGTRLSGLDLRTREAALRGGIRGPALVPGHSAKSLLFKMVTGVRAPKMPPTGKLSASEVAVLRRWIDRGARWSGAPIERAREQIWWSFKLPAMPAVPRAGASTWPRNTIDRFVLAKLRENGLRPSSPASRTALIRRAYLDLIGLPPTPEEVRAFESDRAPDAWEKVIDRLLASPHYGERWGRHWLDLVRFAESSGFEGDKDRPLAYRYRDYVIEAFNRDKPYDAFIREQLAGDEVRPGDHEAIIATGYLACGVEDFAMVKLPQTRADELDDLVSTTSSVFLGLTIGCARCHDHKYDPVKQTDYYRLAALFAPTERRDIEIPTEDERLLAATRNTEVEKELAALREKAAPITARGTQAAIATGISKPNDDQIAAALTEPERAEFRGHQAAIKAAESKRVELPKAMAVTDKKREWEPVHLLIRGDAGHPGPVVQPGFVTSLPDGGREVGPAAATAQTTGRRRALADWIASASNPLTARVWMNRVWRQHFGLGLVNSPSNFGLNGDQPTHPELLDWLALTFQAGGWRLKPMHKMMLLSAVYQQSSATPSRVSPDPRSIDPQNRFLWRMPVRRLEAEAVRDSMLAVAGTLNRDLGGPSVYPPVDASLRADTFQGYNWPEGEDGAKTRRRSVYVKVKRSLIFPQLEVFDCPEITSSVAQRNVTTTPLQALTLMNDPLVLRQADYFAERIKREAGPDPARQVGRTYQLALGRSPTARETALALAFLKQPAASPAGDRLAEFCHAVFNLNEFVYVP